METDIVIRRLRKLVKLCREQHFTEPEAYIVFNLCLSLNRSDNDDEFADELYIACEEILEEQRKISTKYMEKR